MVELEEFEVFQPSPSARVAYWKLRPTNDDLSALQVRVLRSFSPTSDFEEAGAVSYPQTYFVDRQVNLRDDWRDVYYKLVIALDGRTIESGAVCLDTAIDSVLAREMIRRMDLLLRFGGLPVLVYLRRKGARCPECWDPHMKKVTSSTCQSCYATGFAGGYYPPILTVVGFLPEEKSDQPDVTLRQKSQTTFDKMSSFPKLRPRDLIRETGQGNLWRVVRITPVEHERFLVAQENIVVTKLNSGDVENRLPVPTGLEYVIRPHWSRKDIRKSHTVVPRDDDQNPIEEVEIWR